MSTRLLKFWCLFTLLLGLGSVANAVNIIPITSADTVVCDGAYGSYTISPTTGLTYSWSVSAPGNITTSTNSNASILWGAAGHGTVTVKGYNSSHVLIDSGTLSVLVVQHPQPYMTADVRLGCQNPGNDIEHLTAPPGNILDDLNGCIKVCERSQVVYTAHGASTSTYTWIISGATSYSASGNTCTVNWGAVGAGNVKVIETSHPGNCTGSKSVCIDIVERPHASFGAMPDTTLTSINVCNGDDVVFIDRSTFGAGSPIVSWRWDFGDGHYTTSHGPLPTEHHIFYYDPSNPTYTVRLIVTNACGCKDTGYMQVNVSPDAGLHVYCPGVMCDSEHAHYYVDSAKIMCNPPASWSVIGGTILTPPPGPFNYSVDVVWDNVDTSGFGYVTFDSHGCMVDCPNTTTIKVPVVLAHGHISGPEHICGNQFYVYHLPQWPTTDFKWQIVSGSTTSSGSYLSATDQANEITLHAGSTGLIVLKCYYQNSMKGCGGTAYMNIYVDPPVYMSGNNRACLNTTQTYTLSPALSGTWTLLKPNNTTQTYTGSTITPLFNQVGTYELSVVGAFCPPNPLRITVDPLPPSVDSILGPDSVCKGTPTLFTAKNAIGGTIFTWAATNGTVSPASGPTTYANFSASPSVIMVWRETVSSPHCHSDTLKKTLYPYKLYPHVTGKDTVCSSTVWNYTANFPTAEDWQWTLVPTTGSATIGSIAGNGTNNVAITWNTVASPQYVKVIVKVRKCTDYKSDTMLVWVRPTPAISISSVDTVCRGKQVTFTIVPSLTSGTATWSFGDGTGAGPTAVPPNTTTHTFTLPISGPTSYPVTVTVANPSGCLLSTSATKSVVVKPSPVAHISPTGPFTYCDTTLINETLYATVQSGYAPATGYAWYKTTSSSSLSSCPACSTYVNTHVGTYYVVVSGSYGCNDTTNAVTFQYGCDSPGCTITPNPVISFTNVNTACGQLKVTATASAGGFNPTWILPTDAFGVSYSSGGYAVTASYGTAGIYTYAFQISYLTPTGDTCNIRRTYNAVVPYIAGIKYNIVCDLSNPGHYKVTLLDHSNYFSGTPIGNYNFLINGSSVQSGTATSYTSSMLPGDYGISVVISDGTHPSCQADDSIHIPSVPSAAFTFARPITCLVDAPVYFTNTSTPTSGLSYSWTFGDFSSNQLMNPAKVFLTPPSGGYYPVVLTVKDSFGCVSSVTHNVSVHTKDIAGNISGAPSLPCQGTPVIITYNNTGLSMPSTFTWYSGTIAVGTGSSSTYTAYADGGYYSVDTDVYGCRVVTNTVAVNHTQVPPAVISGDTSQCKNVPFTLHGYAGTTVTNYIWMRNGVTVQNSSNPDLAQNLNVGTYTYVLVVQVPNGTGGYCEDTSDVFNVVVHSLPPDPYPSFTMIDCNSYELQLSATNSVPGFYNWSNGLSGTPVTVYEGGPYRVYFTDTFGCQSHADMDVPKDPRIYMWIFPTGCYDFCESKFPFTLLGPIATFHGWQWLNAGAIDLSGTGTVSPYTVTGPSQYNLVLDNGYCSQTSEDMVVTSHKCEKCSGLSGYVHQVYTVYDTLGCNRYVELVLTSGFPPGTAYTITNNHGTFAAGAGTLSPGTSILTFKFLPYGSYLFGGGPITITVTVTMPDGRQCTFTTDAMIPECGQQQTPYRLSHSSGVSSSSNDLAKLMVAPNPAKTVAVVDFHYTGNSDATRDIVVFDAVGRQVANYNAPNADGAWTIHLDGYAPGMYVVAMRQNGKVVLQTKLVVIP